MRPVSTFLIMQLSNSRPGPSGPGTLRFSRLPADARRTHIPPAPGRFRPYFHEEESPRQTHE